MKKTKSKKAQTEVMIFWSWRIFAVILVVIVFAGVVFMRFSAKQDIRPIESAIISEKIVDCITEKNILFAENFNQDRLNHCFDFNEEEIFINLTFKENSFSIGSENLEGYCLSGKKIEGKYMPSCFNENFKVLDNEEKLNDLQIFIVLDKHEQNVK